MTNEELLIQRFLETSKAIKELLATRERLEKETERQKGYLSRLQAENRKLKYEYEDSKLKRDVPMPCNMFCPKCNYSITNWQNYCHMCGQKIRSGNPQYDNENTMEG